MHLNRLEHLIETVSYLTSPFTRGFLILLGYGLVFLAHSLIRNRDLHGDLSSEYVIFLYLGGVLGLVAESLLLAFVFYALFRQRLRVRFGNLFLGMVVFGCVNVVVALVNLAVPLLFTTRVDDAYFVHSVFSALSFIGVEEEHSAVLQATLGLLDLVVIAALAARALYVSSATRTEFWKIFRVKPILS